MYSVEGEIAVVGDCAMVVYPLTRTSKTSEDHHSTLGHSKELYDLTVSVLVPAYNEELNITNLLNSILEQDFDPYELLEILVDASGSNDKTHDLVAEMSRLHSVISLVDIGLRDGLVASLDRLIKLAKGDLIVRVDADIYLPPGTFKPLINRFEDNEIGIVGPRICVNLTNNQIIYRIAKTEYILHHFVSMNCPKTTNLQIFRRLNIDIVGSEAEDTMIQHYVTSSGFKAVYDDSVQIWINSPRTLRELFKQRARCIRTAKWFKARMDRTSPTQSPKHVLPAILTGLGSGEISLIDLSMFLAVEMVTQTYIFLSEALFGHKLTITWEKLSRGDVKEKISEPKVTKQQK